VGTWEDELTTSGIPYSSKELAWARLRPPAYRVDASTIHPGMVIPFRAERWSLPINARVISVTDLSLDHAFAQLIAHGKPDENVWQVLYDHSGEPRLDGFGRAVIELLPDPNPDIILAPDGWRTHTVTRESRLRGDTGWLPADWRERWRPGPHHGWKEGRRGALLDKGLAYLPPGVTIG